MNILNPNFTTRDEYLAFRTQWRAEYKAISQEIRDLKRNIREAYRAGNWDSASSLQSTLSYTRRRANQYMQARTKATELMREQRAARVAEAA